MDQGYNHSYTYAMKTAISIPDDVFDAAEKLARKLAVSRSELYTRAIRTFVDELSDETVTQALNAVYSELESPLDPVFKEMQRGALEASPW
jgi:metal-responsive CopG/Arc/MetJ family transcriptional regulator